MQESGPDRRPWQRGAILAFFAATASIVHPLLLLTAPFAMLAILVPGRRVVAVAISVVLLSLAFPYVAPPLLGY